MCYLFQKPIITYGKYDRERYGASGARRSLAGRFSGAVTALAEQLVRLRMHVEAAIDFPEEEIDFLSDGALLARLLLTVSKESTKAERAAWEKIRDAAKKER